MPVRKARKRGGKATKRGLSDEQVPVLVAADRSGTTFSTVLQKVNADTLQKALAPVMDKHTLLVTDGNNSYPLCATALGVSHEALNQSSGEYVRGELHINNVNNRHSRLKKIIGDRKGIATVHDSSCSEKRKGSIIEETSNKDLQYAWIPPRPSARHITPAFQLEQDSIGHHGNNPVWSG